MSDQSGRVSSPCEQQTYLEWGYPEADYEVSPAVLGPFTVAYCCDGFGPHGCGFQQVHEVGDMTGGVTFEEFATADAAHRTYAKEKANV